MTEPENTVAPGDITVTLVHSGFLIGRAMPEDGPGPWWQYIQTVATQEEAFVIARELAARTGARAWLHLHGDHYREIR
jgi:hypothetical protein